MNRTAEPALDAAVAALPARVAFDGWTLDRVTGDLWKEGVRQRLAEQPLQILDELITRGGELVTREQLIARLWPQGVVEFDTSLNTAVRKLRIALGDDPNQPRYSETLPRKGYRFICGVGVPGAEPAQPPIRTIASEVALTESPPPRSGSPTPKQWTVAALSLVVCIAAVLVWHFGRSPGAASRPTPRVAYDLYLAAQARQPDIPMTDGAQPRQRVLALLNRALAIDPQFAPAYVVRARTNLDFFISNVDVSDGILAAIRDDLDTAVRLSQDPRIGVDVRGLYAALVELDPERGLRLAASAPDDPDALRTRATILMTLARFRESDELFDRFLALDPGNQRLLRIKASNLFVERRGREAADLVAMLRNLSTPGRFPPTLTYALTGEADAPRPSLSQVKSTMQAADAQDHLPEWWSEVEMLRAEGRFAEIHDLLELLQADAVQILPFTGALPGLGRHPVALLRGWNDMLRGNAVAAAQNGRKALDFISRQPVTRWNNWYLRMMAGQAQVLTGNLTGAVAAVGESLRTPAPELTNRHMQVFRDYLAAMTLAWAGERDAAVALLEKLSSGAPSVGPALLAQDPLIATPLRNNARYQKLRSALEIDIAANRAALRPRDK